MNTEKKPEVIEKSKGFITEFKEFISRGNVMDMAVGIIIGGAFTAIVNSLVKDIFSPLLGMIIGGIDFSSLSINLGKASIQYGIFIQNVISFILISLVVFIMIKILNKLSRKADKKEAEEDAAKPVAEDIVLLTEIRDLLKQK